MARFIKVTEVTKATQWVNVEQIVVLESTSGPEGANTRCVLCLTGGRTLFSLESVEEIFGQVIREFPTSSHLRGVA